MMRKCKQWLGLMLTVALLLVIPGAKAEITLKLNGVDTKALSDFAQRHPEVRLDTGDSTYYATTGEMASDMLLCAFDDDVFLLTNSCVDYRCV